MSMSRRKVYVLLLLLVMLTGCARLTAFFLGPDVRHDGIYQTEPRTKGEHTTRRYLRFYPDGTVIAVTSTGLPHHLKRWFKRGQPDRSEGEYRIDEQQIVFSTTSPSGTVDYNGTIDGDELHLQTHSHINQFCGDYVYKFVRW